MTFLENVRKEKHKINASFLPNVSIEKVIDKLKETFYEFKSQYQEILFMYLMDQPQELLNRIYFKNNIYKFSEIRSVRHLISSIFYKADEFKDPNEVPKPIQKELAMLWELYKEFVFYNHPPMGRINRLKYDRRKTVVVVDTDS